MSATAAHGVHVADYAMLADAALRRAGDIEQMARQVADIRHAVATGAGCADDLLEELDWRLRRCAAALRTDASRTI